MKPALLLLLLTFPTLLYGQVTVKGLVTEQNSGNKPIPGVQIKALGTTPEVTGSDGLFRLMFNGKKPGDKIIVSEVFKKGYEIVNKDVVNTWLVPSNPDAKTKIVMCPAGKIAENTLKYYKISMDGLAKGYNDRLNTIREEYEKKLIDAKTFGEQSQILSDQFLKQQKPLEELAERFARENFDDCSEVHKQAFDAFKKGDIGEAIRILETVNSVEEIEKAKKQHQEAEQRKVEIELVLSQTDSIIRQNIRKLKFQGDLYISEFRYDDAGKAYEAAALADTTDFQNVMGFVVFLFLQNHFDKAAEWCRIALANTSTIYEHAQAMRYAANLKAEMNDIEGAEREYRQAADMMAALFKNSFNEYGFDLSAILYDYAYSQIKARNFNKGKTILLEAIELQPKYKYTPVGEARMAPLLYSAMSGPAWK